MTKDASVSSYAISRGMGQDGLRYRPGVELLAGYLNSRAAAVADWRR